MAFPDLHRGLAGAAVAGGLAAAGGAAFAATPTLTYSASPVTQTVSAGEPAVLAFTIRNLGAGYAIVGVEADGATPNYSVRLHDQYGTVPEFTRVGRSTFGPSTSQLRMTTFAVLLKDGSFSETFEVTKFFNLLPHHTYRLSATYDGTLARSSIPLTAKAEIVVR